MLFRLTSWITLFEVTNEPDLLELLLPLAKLFTFQ